MRIEAERKEGIFTRSLSTVATRSQTDWRCCRVSARPRQPNRVMGDAEAFLVTDAIWLSLSFFIDSICILPLQIIPLDFW